MDLVDNNQFEVKPAKSKRKIVPGPNTYLNPALDLLANEDPICNTAMEIVPIKKRKRNKSCSDAAVFDNSALDLGISKAAVNEFLVRELENVKKNIRYHNHEEKVEVNPKLDEKEAEEPIYANLTELSNINTENTISLPHDTKCTSIQKYEDNEAMEISNDDIDSGISVLEQKSLNTFINNDTRNEMLSPITNIQTNITNQVLINNSSNINLSFIDRLALDSPNLSNQSLFYDDDLNESNIMEIKTITIITKKKRMTTKSEVKNTNPFLDPNMVNIAPQVSTQNPFLTFNKPELEYNDEALNRPTIVQNVDKVLEPRRLFGDTNSTISTVNESLEGHEYENVDMRAESPIYENIEELNDFNKQSRILGHDVSQFSAVDILNLNKNSHQDSTDSNEVKKKNSFLKVGNKLSKKVFKTLKRFKGEKSDNNSTLNPYEVPRKLPKPKVPAKESGIENPCLNLDNSDEIEIEELEEPGYETVKTIRNTQLNTNITPLKERNNDDSKDVSHNRTNTPGKKVRFDSTLNQEKVITGNSFDYGLQSPGFDAKLEKYHDELENCINERKYLQQNM